MKRRDHEFKIKWTINKTINTWSCHVMGEVADVNAWTDAYRNSYPTHLYGTQTLWDYIDLDGCKRVSMLRNIDPLKSTEEIR